MAVYTHISDTQLAELLSHYSLGETATLSEITSGIENSNYFLDVDAKRYVLTIFESRVNYDDLPFYLSWMKHVAEAGIACPAPVLTNEGKALMQVAGKPCTIISFLSGGSVEAPEVTHARALGNIMAQMHVASKDFTQTRKNDFGLDRWFSLFDQVKSSCQDLNENLPREIEENLRWLDIKWPANLPQGIIHGDLFTDNVFFEGESLSGVIDFYFAASDTLAYDLAICLNAWCFDSHFRYQPALAKAMVEGYESVRKLEENEKKALPVLASGAAMRFLLTRLDDWFHPVVGANVRPKDPLEYLEKLRFHRSVTSYEGYGV